MISPCWVRSVACAVSLVLLSAAPLAALRGAESGMPVANSIGMKLVLIPAGEFQMGSRESPDQLAKVFAEYGNRPPLAYDRGEYRRHLVRITKPFRLGAHEVTRGQFRQFIQDTGYKTEAEKDTRYPGSLAWNAEGLKVEQNAECTWQNAGFEQTDEHPVASVSSNDAMEFCKWLGAKEGKTYRLPTEAEWEYACRAGTETRYYCGDDPEALPEVANVADGTAKARFPTWVFAIRAKDGYVFTAPVGKFKPNAFGVYDMHGNVGEWCADWYETDYYDKSPTDDPQGPASGERRVLRGGSFTWWPSDVQSAGRYGNVPDFRVNYGGFRVVQSL